jgi:hypothetical protein
MINHLLNQFIILAGLVLVTTVFVTTPGPLQAALLVFQLGIAFYAFSPFRPN